jgi:hypothetical protein
LYYLNVQISWSGFFSSAAAFVVGGVGDGWQRVEIIGFLN